MATYIKTTYLLIFLPFLLYSHDYNPSPELKQNLIFKNLTVEKGLSHSTIRCIMQDSRGFMWFGTSNGLNKYDGYKFIIYKHDPDDSTSLSNNKINAIFEDKNNQLWIGTVGGLDKYDRNTDRFIRYVSKKEDSTSLVSKVIYSIYETKGENQNVLWIGALNGIHRYNPQTDNFKRYFPEENIDNLGYNINAGRSFTQTVSGELWLGTWNEGLFYYDFLNDQFIRYKPKYEYSKLFKNKWARKIYASQKSQKDVIWMATYLNGLYKIETESGKITNYLNQMIIKTKSKDIDLTTIYSDDKDDKILWIGSNQGIYNFNTKSEQFLHYTIIPENPNSLNSNNVFAIYKDRSGILWIGTERGIDIVNMQKSKFVTFKPLPGLKNSLNDKIIKTIAESTIDGKKIIWIGTANNGVNKYDRETGQFTYLKHDSKNPNSLSSDIITTILIPQNKHRKKIWIATATGLNIIDITTGLNKQIYLEEKDALYAQIRCMCEDKKGNIWAGTENGMVYCFNPEGEKINWLSAYRGVQALHTDSFGNLWIGTFDGLKKYDLKTAEARWYRNIQKDLQSIINNDISSIYEDKNKVLWIGTSGGLNKYIRHKDIFLRFTESDGLPNNNIIAMLEDDKGNLWISTSKGISRFNPKNKTFKNFDAGDGLQGDQFKNGSAFKNNDGEMFFGGINGFTIFHPDSIYDNPHIPPILLTDFQIFNKSVKIDKNSVLTKHISETKEITLSYDQSVFSFEFAALDYHNPLKNQYTYKMEGVDPDWVHTNASRRFATYTNLDPGEYVFSIIGSNNDGVWNEEGISIKITILPPWWRTNWAYSFYVLFILCMAYGVWRFQANRLKMKHEMEMEHFEAEKLREVDHLKSSFFANISHEFRTPLTLIQGPVRQMFSGEFKGNLKETFGMILRYSDRLLNLINQILDLSKLESGRMVLRVSHTDMAQYLKGVVQSFASLAERKKISLKFNGGERSLMGFVDRDKLEKIVTNLLSNAFKFTPEGGSVKVNLSLRGDMASAISTKQSPFFDGNEIASLDIRRVRKDSGGPGFIQISIFNSGVGIPPDQLDKIFDRFYQADASYTKDSEGSGIGLALTKELVEAHHGEIRVESELNKGTTFTVWLPVQKEQFKPEEIVDIPGEEVPPISPPLPKGETKITPLEGGTRRAGDVSYDTVTNEAIAKPKIPKSSPLLLIVEDNPDVTTYISSFLEKDYRIITAENGKVGLKKTLDKFPDLIISDVMMPVMDGFQFCRKLKSDQRTSHIPLILLTARADMESKLEGLEFGADDYVTKPFDAKELSVRAKNLLEQRRRLREHFQREVEFQPSEITVNSLDEQFMQKAIALIEQHMDDIDFSAEKFSREIGMSHQHLNRKLHAITNHSARDFIRIIRLKRAAQLLNSKSDTVTQIAYQIGFNNPSYFAECFRQQFGMSPSKYSSQHSK